MLPCLLGLLPAAAATRIPAAATFATSELTSHGRLAVHTMDGAFNADGTASSLGSVWESAGIGFGSPQDDRAPVIGWDLGQAHAVGRIDVWNFPEASPAIKRALVESSLDGLTYSPVREVSLAAWSGPSTPDQLVFENLIARFVRLRVLEIHGGDVYPVEPGTPIKGFAGFAGLTEVAFWGAAVPPLPGISQQPGSRTVEVGETVSFTVGFANAGAGLSYQWLKDGKELPGEVTNQLEVRDAELADAGEYRLRVSNGVESLLSLPATLTVKAGPVVTDDFAAGTRSAIWSSSDENEGGGSLHDSNQRLEYLVGSPGAAGWDQSYRPLSGAVTVPHDHDWEARVEVHNSVTAGNGKSAGVGMTLFSPDRGQYVFLELYALGSTRGFVTGLDADGEPVGVDGNTGNLGVVAGSVRLFFNGATKVISAFYDADGPDNGYQWVHLASYGVAGAGGSLGNDDWELGQGDALVLAIGGYSEGLGVATGQAYLDNFYFSREPAAQKPFILAQPRAAQLVAGQAAQFTVTAGGTAPLTYQWRKGGVALSNGGNVSGADTAMLVLADVQVADSGDYSVVVGNSAGSVTSEAAALSVRSPLPGISQQPGSRTVEVGETVSFTVGFANAGAGLSYQWLKDGKDLPGEVTNQLEVRDAELADAGEYRLRVSNGVESLLSLPAILTVVPPAEAPTITAQPPNRTVTAGQAVEFAVTATGTAPLTYQWRKDGVALGNGGRISGADTATLVLADVQTADAGSYDVVVSNATGNKTSDPVVLTVTVGSEPQKITGITATATSELASHNRFAAHAVDGIYQDSNFWESVGTVEGFGVDRDPAITFDLGSARQLDHFLIWNSHEPSPAIKRMFVEVSLDGVSFTRLPGEFALVSNLAVTPQKVPLGGVTARFVRFDILENYAGVIFPVVGNPPGWSLVAIDEVEFYSTGGGTGELPVTNFLEWYRADSVQFTGLADGDPIVNWLPETGSAATPVPVQVVGQEIRYRKSVAGLNGRSALEFPGGPSVINNIAKVDFNGVSLFLVFRNIGSGGLQRAVAGLDSNTLLGPWNPNQAGRYNPTIHLGGVWKIHPEDVVGWSDPGTCVLSVVMDDVATERSFINGVELDSTKGGAGPMDTTGIGRLSFGGGVGAFGEPYKGYIAEFIVYKRVLAAAETAAVHDYLLTKYGLNGTTPTAPEITGQPAGLTVPPGGTAQFTVTATGTAPLRYQWRKGGVALSNGGNVSGADTATLFLANVQTTDAGSYDVVVSNAAGADTSEAAVLLVEDASEPQKITGIVATATSELASHGRLAANAVNGVYLDSYFWESVGVGQGFGEDRDPAITFDLQAVFRLDHLLIWNSHERDPAIKRLRLELSEDGVSFTAMPGEFTLQAVLDPQKLALGGRLARFVRIDILENYAGVTFPVTGIPGGWSLVAIDEVEFFGQPNDQTPVAPTITQEPQNLAVTAGQTAQFSVKAAGSAPLNYQWHRGGNALVDGGSVSGATTARLTLANVALDAAGSYDVTVGNAVGTATSATVTLTVNPAPAAPAIVQQPANTTAVPGQAASFSVTAVGTAPLSYQWFHTAVAGGAEIPVVGATSAVLTLGNVTAASAGTYRVRVSNTVNPGGVFSQPAALTVVLLERGFVTRILPGAYVPGQAFGVALEAKPAAGVSFYAVFDQPPAGWTVSAINEGGTFDARTGRVKFGPFADNAARTLRYTVLPPPNASDRQEFFGIASADGVDGDIRGSGLIETSLNHPADLNGDRQLVITEITGYGAAWKQGATWSLPPNPLPVNYVTRAGFLWRNGERYRFDPAAGVAPLWWLPEAAAGPTRRVSRQGVNAASSATRSFMENQVKLAVAPADAVAVHAVEERLFAGFKATAISHGGVFLPEQGLIRWGPFFDHQPRELTYTVTPPPNFEGEIAVLGVLSVDGESFPASGDSVLRFGMAELPPPVTPELAGSSFKLDVAGPLNARVVIETSEALGGVWTVATEFELNRPDQSWSVPVEIQQSGKFFRVRVIVP